MKTKTGVIFMENLVEHKSRNGVRKADIFPPEKNSFRYFLSIFPLQKKTPERISTFNANIRRYFSYKSRSHHREIESRRNVSTGGNSNLKGTKGVWGRGVGRNTISDIRGKGETNLVETAEME
ncbi:hypothetical protein CEXT_779781 [Caerostris extrusa]|uniref:Uncharacterized protein n=1 Tax=Caerostris extrusa TaxID=172846 RepID=A0AAV4Y663_CAEEX|nr:hypothetical protein CEXT_779781 [Caerostris extrusa]